VCVVVGGRELDSVLRRVGWLTGQNPALRMTEADDKGLFFFLGVSA